ncbi:hypothetical protein [Heyndrickxia vini]|uniref:Uncharacterized protein n=1 Tax=Heyndrickxia vini TaxID=1476025 RepID=A0ABX7DY68_9BACI|nr:hypothetical protein [Heyndrickxia vini]QQZ07924.1 hypothetical protein I5776_12580 [Heyndrickxia vini]
MELKSIEMQIALPKSIDVSKQTQELQKDGQMLNENAMIQVEKELQKKRQNVIRSEQKDGSHIKKDSKDNSFQHELKKHKNGKSIEQNHPFKGKNVDYSG